ncbi:MAG: hypothetical protein LBI38_00750 [Oscillospiraceae bacterium]|jgi:DNA anti-recombination protein RmuC|nr:hypothetical protein [Oscillospiraceae bacterium]
MRDLIERIIEIDKDGQKRVEDANEKAREILDGANAEKAEIEREYADRIDKRLKIVGESYARMADEDIGQILRRKAEREAMLDKAMEQNGARWEKEILERITGAKQ